MELRGKSGARNRTAFLDCCPTRHRIYLWLYNDTRPQDSKTALTHM